MSLWITSRAAEEVTDRSPGRVTDPKSLTLPYRQRSEKPVTPVTRGVGVTGYPIDVVARARVRARKVINLETAAIGHPDGVA